MKETTEQAAIRRKLEHLVGQWKDDLWKRINRMDEGRLGAVSRFIGASPSLREFAEEKGLSWPGSDPPPCFACLPVTIKRGSTESKVCSTCGRESS